MIEPGFRLYKLFLRPENEESYDAPTETQVKDAIKIGSLIHKQEHKEKQNRARWSIENLSHASIARACRRGCQANKKHFRSKQKDDQLSGTLRWASPFAL